MLLGDVFKLATFFQAGNDGLGIGFFFNQDMARLVFLAAVGSGELVVFGLEVGVSDRVGFLVVGKQLADHQRLARQFHLCLELITGGNALLFGFLHEHFAGNHFFAQLAFHFRRYRPTGFGDLLGQCIKAGFGNGFAVDDGDVLRHRAGGAQCQQTCQGRGQ